MRFRLAIAAVASASPVVAQQRAMTNADYARAERFMSYNTAPLVAGGAVRPTWLPADRFVYRVAASDSSGDVMIVDPVRGTRARLLDDAKLAATVATALGTTADAIRQPSTKNRLSADGRMVIVSLAGRSVSCDVATTRCFAAVEERVGGGRGGGAAPMTLSPDGSRGAFIRDWNLWMRDFATGRETQLTRDGVKDFGYATDNAGWTSSDRAILVWSPDSKKIATFQQDQRNVGEMYLVGTRVGHPELRAW